MTRRTITALVAVAVAMGLAACGERPQVVNYKQGTYAGKQFSQPWSGVPWEGRREDWDNAIRTRQQSQNERKRIGS